MKKLFQKVERYWGTCHDVKNTKTGKVVATLWTLDEAKKEKEYFDKFVGLDLDKLDFAKKKFYVKKAEDNILDIVVNVKKFNKKIFEEIVKII